MKDKFQALRLYSPEQLQALRAKSKLAMTQWALEWEFTSVQIESLNNASFCHLESPWVFQMKIENSSTLVYVSLQRTEQKQLVEKLLAAAIPAFILPNDILAKIVIDGLVKQVLQSCIELLLPNQGKITEHKGEKSIDVTIGRGLVQLKLIVDDIRFDVFFNPSDCKKLNLPKVAPTIRSHKSFKLSSWRHLINDNVLGFKVGMLGVDVQVSDITELKIGDVITLDHSVEAPVVIELSDGTALAEGFLGKQGHRKAIKINQGLKV